MNECAYLRSFSSWCASIKQRWLIQREVRSVGQRFPLPPKWNNGPWVLRAHQSPTAIASASSHFDLNPRFIYPTQTHTHSSRACFPFFIRFKLMLFRLFFFIFFLGLFSCDFDFFLTARAPPPSQKRFDWCNVRDFSWIFRYFYRLFAHYTHVLSPRSLDPKTTLLPSLRLLRFHSFRFDLIQFVVQNNQFNCYHEYLRRTAEATKTTELNWEWKKERKKTKC